MATPNRDTAGRFAGSSLGDLLPVVAMYDAGTAQADGTMKPGNLVSVFITAQDQSYTQTAAGAIVTPKRAFDGGEKVSFDGPQGKWHPSPQH